MSRPNLACECRHIYESCQKHQNPLLSRSQPGEEEGEAEKGFVRPSFPSACRAGSVDLEQHKVGGEGQAWLNPVIPPCTLTPCMYHQWLLDNFILLMQRNKQIVEFAHWNVQIGNTYCFILDQESLSGFKVTEYKHNHISFQNALLVTFLLYIWRILHTHPKISDIRPTYSTTRLYPFYMAFLNSQESFLPNLNWGK